MKSEGSAVLVAEAFLLVLLAVTGGGDAHVNEPVSAPGVPPPKVNDGKKDEYCAGCRLVPLS